MINYGGFSGLLNGQDKVHHPIFMNYFDEFINRGATIDPPALSVST